MAGILRRCVCNSTVHEPSRFRRVGGRRVMVGSFVAYRSSHFVRAATSCEPSVRMVFESGSGKGERERQSFPGNNRVAHDGSICDLELVDLELVIPCTSWSVWCFSKTASCGESVYAASVKRRDAVVPEAEGGRCYLVRCNRCLDSCVDVRRADDRCGPSVSSYAQANCRNGRSEGVSAH